MTTTTAPADDITLPDQTEVARQLWGVLREIEDRCDEELEDIENSHVVWQLANVAIAAVRTPQPAKCLTCGGSGWLGGPSYYNPGEGGEPCTDCAPVAGPQIVAWDDPDNCWNKKDPK